MNPMTTALHPLDEQASPRTDWRRSAAFFWLLARRDLKARYAGSSLGAVWNFVHPIAMILIYIAIFSSMMKTRAGANSGPVYYSAHLCTGMLVWLAFTETLNRCAAALTDNAAFLKKVWFPPWLLHASALFNALIIYLVGYGALVALLAALGFPLAPGAALVPGIMLLAGLSAMGLGMLLSGLNVFFRDTAQALTIILQIGFWANPIVYPFSQIESSLGDWAFLFRLNPMESFISAAQAAIGDPAASPWAGAPWVIALFPVVCLGVGALIFRRMLPDVRDGL